ncbi:MAG: hypothetical protein NXH82_13925 [Rhodobacteraceae bacterium]|nr:hypothetical protein [Paracoccaceae bacterium]
MTGPVTALAVRAVAAGIGAAVLTWVLTRYASADMAVLLDVLAYCF